MTDGKICEFRIRVAGALDVSLMTVPFAMYWYLYGRQDPPLWAGGRADLLPVGVFLFLYVLFGRIYDAFGGLIRPAGEIVYSRMMAALAADGTAYLAAALLGRRLPGLVPGAAAVAGQLALSVLWTWLARRWYFAVFPAAATGIVRDEGPDIRALIGQKTMERAFDVRWCVPAQQVIREPALLDEVEAVFVCGVHSHDRNIILKHCIRRGRTVYVVPRLGDTLMSAAREVHLFSGPLLRVGRDMAAPEYRLAKRMMDVVLSGLGLLAASPVFLVTAIAIKAADGGPVFYRQTRLTRDGRPFEILKFRSMRVDAEKDGVARLSTGDRDDRITPVGRFIRRMRIDELPQLVQCLTGVMSLVGPRAERPELYEVYTKELPEFALRLQVKAGLTGYAQVYGRYNTTPYDKLQMDLMYIAHPGILQDLKILLATVKVLFQRESTEGVAEGQTTAAGGPG